MPRPKSISDETWSQIKELGIRKPNRSRRGGRKKSSKMPIISSCPVAAEISSRRSPVIFPDMIVANVRSLLPKLDELQSTADVFNAGLICITETWLNYSVPDSTIQLVNYICFRRDRP